MIGQLLAFLMSPFAMFGWLAGFVFFLLMPIIPKATGYFQGFARYSVGLAFGMLQRAAILVSEHDDILLKRMTFDDLGVERITIGGERKEFEDPDDALHTFAGIPFALADEVHGLLFDPRHAAVGQRKAADTERNENIVPATNDEFSEHGIDRWYKGVYEFAQDTYELVNLSAVRQLVDGGERAEYPQRVEREYEHSRSPFQSSMSSLRIVLILAAILGPFMVVWFGVWQFGKPDSTMSFGILALLLSTGGVQTPNMDLRKAALAAVLVLVPVSVLGLVTVVISPVVAIGMAVMAVLGWAFIPFLTFLLRSSTRLADTVGGLLWKHGMMGFDRPVFEWTRREYVLREHHNLSDVAPRPQWYALGGKKIGFTFAPSEESWDAEVVDKNKVKARQEVAADGGETGHDPDTNVPAGYAKTPTMTRAEGKYAAFVPKRIKDAHYYLDSAIAKARFRDSADGSKSVERLLWAKENKTENNGNGELKLMYMVAGLGTVSFVVAILVFFVLL